MATVLNILIASLVVVTFGCERSSKKKAETVRPAMANAQSEDAENGTPNANGAEPVSREDCRAILEKSDRLIGHKGERDPVKTEREIDECIAVATPVLMACAKAATTYEELKTCEPKQPPPSER